MQVHFKLVKGNVDVVFTAQLIDSTVQLIDSTTTVTQFTHIQTQLMIQRAGTKCRKEDFRHWFVHHPWVLSRRLQQHFTHFFQIGAIGHAETDHQTRSRVSQRPVDQTLGNKRFVRDNHFFAIEIGNRCRTNTDLADRTGEGADGDQQHNADDGHGNEIGVNSYNELLKKFTEDEYYFISKKIRQVIFGDLNPARQQRIQKFVINNLCKKLKENGCILSSASSDEIIIQNPDLTSKDIKEILKDTPEEFKFFRVEDFVFEKIDENHDFFVKTTLTETGPKTEFKNVPGHVFSQVYKRYLNQESNDYDLLFYHEGFLAQFKEKLFEQELTKKLKLK